MLEKNKDYIEMCISSTDCTFTRNTVKFSIEGYIDSPLCWSLPDPGYPYVIISKEKFEALQTENEQLKKKFEECEKDYRLKRDKSMLLEQEIKIYTKALQDWKEGTGCPSPSAAKTMIESGMSWHHAYNEIKEVNKKLADSIKAWQNVTGDATPEDYLAAMIKNTAKTVLSWQEITGFSTPEKCSSYIDTLEKKLEDIKDLIEED